MEEQKQPQIAEEQLLMFYGMLNIDILAQILPFSHMPQLQTKPDKLAHLKSKAVSLTCPGYKRVFAATYASIEPVSYNEAAAASEQQLKTFGVYLTEEQVAACDDFEDVGVDYDRITVDVIIHRSEEEPNVQGQAQVFQMREEMIAR